MNPLKSHSIYSINTPKNKPQKVNERQTQNGEQLNEQGKFQKKGGEMFDVIIKNIVRVTSLHIIFYEFQSLQST